MSPYLFFLMQFAILAYALVGGVFLAFSDFIMRSLSLTGGVGGVDAGEELGDLFGWRVPLDRVSLMCTRVVDHGVLEFGAQ